MEYLTPEIKTLHLLLKDARNSVQNLTYFLMLSSSIEHFHVPLAEVALSASGSVRIDLNFVFLSHV